MVDCPRLYPVFRRYRRRIGRRRWIFCLRNDSQHTHQSDKLHHGSFGRAVLGGILHTDRTHQSTGQRRRLLFPARFMHLVGKILFRRHRQPEFRYRIAALHNRRRILSGFGLCRLEHRHFARQHDRSCRRILFHPDFFCLHFILPTANAPSRRVLAGRGNGLPRFIRLLAGNAHCRTETILIGIPYQTMPIPPRIFKHHPA